jgi:hypothetical protein
MNSLIVFDPILAIIYIYTPKIMNIFTLQYAVGSTILYSILNLENLGQ